jgi:RNA polymerase sigma-70 factor (ECF subfamily)
LVRLLQSGDKQAFEYFYERYSAAVYGIILKIVKIEELAEEVLQDAFLKFWDKIKDYNPEKGRLFTWMLSISRNMAIDKFRSKEFKGIRKTDDILDNVHIFDEGYSEKNKSEYIGIKELVKTLSVDQQKIIDLMYFQGYSQSEIAEEYDIPLGTVKTRAKAAMQKLREMFK